MVKVAYRGYFDDGATFIDQTRQPIEFPCADGWMPPAFVDAVRDMAVGETKRVRVGADEAYEKRTEERVIEVERAKIPADIKLAVGDVMSLERPDGQTYPARLVELDEERAVFDLNHDVIAKALNFEITLLDVRDLPKRWHRGRLKMGRVVILSAAAKGAGASQPPSRMAEGSVTDLWRLGASFAPRTGKPECLG